MRRETEAWPTKSGVIGMISAALGIARNESLARFEGLRFGVRADQPGTVMCDFQTAEGEKTEEKTHLSWRYYLQDAVFLAALEGDDRGKLEEYQHALAAPYYQLFLGRRSCPPDGPVQTWLSEEGLEDSLRHAPWRATEQYQRYVLNGKGRFRTYRFPEIVIEPRPDESKTDDFVEELIDEPISFDQRRREWKPRRIMRLRNDVQPAPTVMIPSEGNNDAVAGEMPPSRDTPFDDDTFFDAVADATLEEL
jgi:CRISPR system Cascade subunit CasD